MPDSIAIASLSAANREGSLISEWDLPEALSTGYILESLVPRRNSGENGLHLQAVKAFILYMPSKMACAVSLDQQFGPRVATCRRGLDFTLLFEEWVFSVIPSVAFLLLGIGRFGYLLLTRHRVVMQQRLQYTKIATIFVLGSIQLALLCLWAKSATFKTKVSIPAATLEFIGSLLLGFLSYKEHETSLRPSNILTIYLLFNSILDIARTRTLWMLELDHSIPILFTISFAVRVILLGLELKKKTEYIQGRRYDDYAPEDLSGMIESTFFWWINPLLIAGYKHPLALEELSPISSSLSSELLGTSAGSAWDKNRAEPRRKHELILSLLKTYRWFLLIPIFPRLCLVALKCAQPLLLQKLVIFLEMAKQSDTNSSIGWAIVLAYGLVYLGLAASTALYWHGVYRSMTVFRGSLVTLVYDNIIKMSVSDVTDSKVVTLINADIERINKGLMLLHEIWACLIQVSVASYILQTQLGTAFLGPIMITLFCGSLTFFFSKAAPGRQARWLKAVEARIGITTAVLGDLKGVALSGLAEKFTTMIQNMRLNELEAAAKFRRLRVYGVANAYSPSELAPVLTFGMFVGLHLSSGQSLDVSKMFTSLAAINLVTEPLGFLFQTIPDVAAALACCTRIQIFLEAGFKSKAESTIQPCPGTNESKDIPLKDLGNMPMDRLGDEQVLEIRSSAFGWSRTGTSILNNINLKIDKSKFYFIIGPVASGKSTLLKSMIGETTLLQGQLLKNFEKVAFCDQIPWLFNGTIRQNILGYSMYDASWYEAVIRACSLDIDLQQMPEGDQTRVGSKGLALSGGQKQRLAIARAVYARTNFMVLDDVFASLDARTEHYIFDKLLGSQGLLRQGNMTVVLATNSVQYTPLADQIIMLSQDGRIAEQGSPEQLALNGVNLGRFANMKEINVIEQEPESQEQGHPRELKNINKQGTNAEANQRAISGDSAVWRYYTVAVGVSAVVYFLCANVCYAFFTTFSQIWIKWWSDTDSTDLHVVGKYLGVYVAFQILILLMLQELIRFSGIPMVIRVGRTLHWRILKTVMSAPMTIFKSHEIGAITNRFSQDMQLIDTSLSTALSMVSSNGMAMIGEIALTVVPSPYLTIAIPFIFAVLYCLQKYYLRTSRQLRVLDLEANAPLLSHLLETVDGLISIRAFGWNEGAILRCRQLLDASQKPFYLMYCVQRWLTLVLDLTATGLTVLLVSVAVALRNSTSTGFTAVALINLMNLNTNMMLVIVSWTNLETSLGAVARVKHLEEDNVAEDVGDETIPPPIDWPQEGEIEFHKVVASYHSSQEPVLRGVSFTIEAGEKVAICGRTGSGKSSAVLALARMIPVHEGWISVDGVNLSNIDRNVIRSKLNILPQSPVLVPGTYRANADFHEVASDHAIKEALEIVGLWDIVVAAGGLDAQMDSSSLSVGQKQLFCLARAILRPCKIVILDEATSNVDHETDQKMQKIIRERFADKTVLCITHRVQTILDFDKVIVLDAGEVIEFDEPHTLLGRPTSIFKMLYDRSGGQH